MTVEIDEATGLPVLPDGDFWRVKRFSRTALVLQRRRKRWIGSRVIDDGLILLNRPEYGSPLQQLRAKAERLHEPMPAIDLIGDYPPKRLQP